jgi:hypothetical protein
MDVLRAEDSAPLSTDAIAGRIIEAKAFDAADAALRKAIAEQALAVLHSFRSSRSAAWSDRSGWGAACAGRWSAFSWPCFPWYFGVGEELPFQPGDDDCRPSA